MASSEPLVIALERFLPYRLSILSNTISGAIANAYAERFGLSIYEWRVMAVLARFPESSAAEVARRCSIDKVAVSRAVSGLLEKELVDREMAAEDRRRSVLTLSEKGWQTYGEIVPFATGYEQQLLSVFSAEELDALDGLLTKLMDRATAISRR